jgi:hypothetical protein
METSSFNTQYIETFFWTFLSIVGIVLMGLTYTYIDKLERIKCACAEHPYKNFIKNYILFAIAFLIITAFLPPSRVVGMIGPLYAIAYVIAMWIYIIATIVFFAYSLLYVRYLAREKCKCSEDLRREVLYWWSITELVILAILVVLPFLIMFINGGIALSISSGKQAMKNLESSVMMTTVNPAKGVKKATTELSKTVKDGVKNLKKITTK